MFLISALRRQLSIEIGAITSSIFALGDICLTVPDGIINSLC